MHKLVGGSLFAFDIGTNSIGWAVLGLDQKSEPRAIVDAGVRIFSDGREPKSGTSLAEGRRAARAMARRRDRYKRRRKATLRTLGEFGLMPTEIAAQKALLLETSDQSDATRADGPLTDPYNLRLRALSEKLPLSHIGRALFHLNQRRGFKSNRKTDKKSNEKGAIELGVDRLRTMMAETKAPTLGAFLAMRRAEGKPVRVRGGAVDGKGEEVGGSGTSYDFYPDRALLEDEFDRIWAAQAAHYPEILTEARRAHLRKVMFFQRPLKPAVVGRCSFNPSEPRVPRAHPLFQEFRLYKEVNELELVDGRQHHVKLDKEQRDRLVQFLRTTSTKGGKAKTHSYASLRTTLRVARDLRFNKEKGARESMLGDEVASALSAKDCFGQRWLDLSREEQWRIVDRLREEQDPDVLRNWLESEHGLSGAAAKAIAEVQLPEGYGRLGETALSTMLDYLKQEVIPEAEAAKLAGYDHALLRNGDAYDLLPNYQEVLERRIPPGTNNPEDPYDVEKGRITNPTVHIGLNQLRRVVNGLMRRYGKPERIAIELARDLNQSEEQKKKVNKRIAQNTRDAEQRSLKLRELGQRDNGHNRMLLKLWEELNPEKPEDRCCIYTGRPISLSMLFSGAVDIDHILPWSKTLDDSQGNRILCLREANRVKGNRAPADVAEWAGHYDEILDRANRLHEGKRWRFARDAMERFEKDRDFLDRQLTDTQHLARLAHDYLGALYPDEEPDGDGVLFRRNHVVVVTGRLTEMLRRHWHLNDLLHDHNYGETAKGKNRKDHRHHAIDAAVIGVTTRGMLKKIADAARQGENQGAEDAARQLPPPWDGFRDELREKVSAIVVSHKPDHGTLPSAANGKGKGQTAGRLHNDTAYGLLRTPLPNGDNVVRRKMLSSLKEGDLAHVADAEIRRRLQAATAGLSGNAFKEALLHFARTDPVFKGMRRLRVTETLHVIPISSGAPIPYKGYKGDANYRYDVWEMPDGRWISEVVSMFDAHRPRWVSEVRATSPTARKVLSLQQNDMVAYDHPTFGPVVGLVVKFGQNGQITLVPHAEAGDLKRRDALPSTEEEANAFAAKSKAGGKGEQIEFDPFKYYSPTAGGLKKIRLRQVRVDETGRVFDPGPQDRESRLARKAAFGLPPVNNK